MRERERDKGFMEEKKGGQSREKRGEEKKKKKKETRKERSWKRGVSRNLCSCEKVGDGVDGWGGAVRR